MDADREQITESMSLLTFGPSSLLGLAVSQPSHNRERQKALVGDWLYASAFLQGTQASLTPSGSTEHETKLKSMVSSASRIGLPGNEQQLNTSGQVAGAALTKYYC